MDELKDQLDPRSVLREGDAAMKAGDIPRALASYERAGEMYEVLDLRLKALSVWKTMLELASERLDIRLRLGEGYAALGLKEQASAELQVVLAIAMARGELAHAGRARIALATL